MMTKLALVTSTFLALATGCGTDDDASTATIEASPLAGVVAGQSWSFTAGHTNAFLSEGEDDFFASLYPTTFTACGFSEPSGPHIIVAIPKAVGEFELSLSRNMTFVVGDSENLVGINGRIRVDSVSETNVKGGLVARYDDDNEINGTFDVTVCADDE